LVENQGLLPSSNPGKEKLDLFEFFPLLFDAAHNDDAPADDSVQPSDSDVNKATFKRRRILAGQAKLTQFKLFYSKHLKF